MNNHHQPIVLDPSIYILYTWTRGNGSPSGSQLKQEDPPNLSILLSGGKETNQDSLSKGD